MGFANPDFDALPQARQSNGGEEGVKERVQCLAALAVTLCAATPDAAFPSGGIKMGTTNADRIIKTANPTKTSTSVKRQCSFFISVCPSPFAYGLSNSISKLRMALPGHKDYNNIRINILEMLQGQAADGKGFAWESDGIRQFPSDNLRLSGRGGAHFVREFPFAPEGASSLVPSRRSGSGYTDQGFPL